MDNVNTMPHNDFPPKPAQLVNRCWLDLLRIAELVPTHVLLQITPTATGHIVVSDRDIVLLSRSLDIKPAELRIFISLLNKENWFSRLGVRLLKRYAECFPPLPANLQRHFE